MRPVWLGLLIGMAGLAGCATPSLQSSRWIDPSMAVQLAAAAGEKRGVDGVFALSVRATGQQGGNIYLNSQSDYRDPRNLTVVLSPAAQAGLKEKFGPDLERAFRRMPILVRGSARMVRIDFLNDNGAASGAYYYQTHVRVTNAAQVQRR